MNVVYPPPTGEKQSILIDMNMVDRSEQESQAIMCCQESRVAYVKKNNVKKSRPLGARWSKLVLVVICIMLQVIHKNI